jgi:hypothetical protein
LPDKFDHVLYVILSAAKDLVCWAIRASKLEILRCAQDDMVGWPIVVVKVHQRVLVL